MSTPIFQSITNISASAGSGSTSTNAVGYSAKIPYVESTPRAAQLIVSGSLIVMPTNQSVIQVFDTVTSTSKFYPTPFVVQSLFFVNSKYFISNYMGDVYTSNDLTTWTDVKGINANISSLIYFNNKYYATIARNQLNSSLVSTTYNFYYTSSDGVIWTTQSSPASTQFNAISYIGTTLVAVTGSGASIVIYNSADNGSTWVSKGTVTNIATFTNYQLTSNFTNLIALHTISYANNTNNNLTGNFESTFYSSADGATWSTKAASSPVTNVSYVSGTWFFNGTSPSTSTDLSTWSPLPTTYTPASNYQQTGFAIIGTTKYFISIPVNRSPVKLKVNTSGTWTTTDSLQYNFYLKWSNSTSSIISNHVRLVGDILYAFDISEAGDGITSESVFIKYDTINKTFSRKVHSALTLASTGTSYGSISNVAEGIYIEGSNIHLKMAYSPGNSNWYTNGTIYSQDNGITWAYATDTGTSCSNNITYMQTYHLSDTFVTITHNNGSSYWYIYEYEPTMREMRQTTYFGSSNVNFDIQKVGDDLFYTASNVSAGLYSYRQDNFQTAIPLTYPSGYVFYQGAGISYLSLSLNNKLIIKLYNTSNSTSKNVEYVPENKSVIPTSDIGVYKQRTNNFYMTLNGSDSPVDATNYGSTNSGSIYYSIYDSSRSLVAYYTNLGARDIFENSNQEVYNAGGFLIKKINNLNTTSVLKTTLTSNGVIVPPGKTFIGKLIVQTQTSASGNTLYFNGSPIAYALGGVAAGSDSPSGFGGPLAIPVVLPAGVYSLYGGYYSGSTYYPCWNAHITGFEV